ncbi:hypothetical protein LR69_01254 [Geobacillus sp. BCO2]|nr:hypothetical protein LR69_01254 [Geobacillus sp. BCO2]
MKRKKRRRKVQQLKVKIAERLPEIAERLGFKGEIK